MWHISTHCIRFILDLKAQGGGLLVFCALKERRRPRRCVAEVLQGCSLQGSEVWSSATGWKCCEESFSHGPPAFPCG